MIISIEGAIAVGKTRLINQLRKIMKTENILFIDEPIEYWKDYHGTNTFDLFYSNPKQNAFAFQNLVLQSMLHRQLPHANAQCIVMERSLNSSLLFINEQYRDNIISKMQMHILQDWVSILKTAYPFLKPQAVILLKKEPTLALEHIKIRNRPEEANINVKYLERIEEAHELMYHESPENIALLTIDCNKTLDKMEWEYQRVAKWINMVKGQHQP